MASITNPITKLVTKATDDYVTKITNDYEILLSDRKKLYKEQAEFISELLAEKKITLEKLEALRKTLEG